MLTSTMQNNKICNVYPGFYDTICSDKNHVNIWAAGSNAYGQCCVVTKNQTILGRLLKKENHQLSHLPSWTRITYFKENGIKIHKICVSLFGCVSFFISDMGRVYAVGKNSGGQFSLGRWSRARQAQYKPVLIKQLSGVMEVCSTTERSSNMVENQYCVALCGSDRKYILIMSHWARKLHVHGDVLKLLLIFVGKTTTVYSSGTGPGTGHPSRYGILTGTKLKSRYCWNAIAQFQNKCIIKISVGGRHSLFLEDDGNVWTCGKNGFGLGLKLWDTWSHRRWKTVEMIDVPQRIPYFAEQNINIVDIQSGESHNLALDEAGRVYAFGKNDDGACGVQERVVIEPLLINIPFKFKVNTIRCGASHSYCKTECGKHFMFGHNMHGECLMPKTQSLKFGFVFPTKVHVPCQIGAWSLDLTQGSCAICWDNVEVQLGISNTFISVPPL